MRTIVSLLVALLTIASAGTADVLAQADQVPVFRSGIEVMEVDVNVVDGNGMPVRDLRAPEFVVTVDGQPRRVLSAEFISENTGPGGKPVAPRDPYVSNNSDRRPGRLILLAIDRNNIDTHSLRGATAALKSFVNGLNPEDRMSLVTVPPPGPSVDFTTNHTQILDALSRIVGMDDPIAGRFNISAYEALTFETRSNPMTTQRLLYRVCGDTDPNTMSPCDRDVEQEAFTLAAQIRQMTSESVSGFAALLKSLRDVEGAKSLIIISQGLMLEGGQGEATSLANLAAEARVNVNVLMFDAPIGTASQARISETIAQDRELRETGLETLASRSRGSLFRVVANPQYVFERVRNEISAHYMLGVEPAERDRDGKSHQIRVEVRRQGVQVRARRQVQYAVRTPNNWSRDVLMARVLRSPAANTELPMRLSSYIYRDGASNKIKLIIAAEIDPASMEKELDLAIGFAVFNQVGAPVVSGQERKIYSANSDLPIRYDLAIAVDPGTYRLRLAAIDTAGTSGSVEREIQAYGMSNQAVAVGDLILSAVREGKAGDVRPPVILQITDGQLATYTELYTNKAGTLDDTRVSFEVADTEDGPTLQTGVAEIRERTDKTMRQAMAVVPVGALPPGRYIARAIISSSDKIVGKLTRPFTIAPSAVRRNTPVDAGSVKGDTPAVVAKPGASAIATGIVISARPSAFKKEDVLTPDMLSAVFEVMDKTHPAAKAATARARAGKLDGTALMALDAGDQAAGSLLRGLELLLKGQLDPAANQFNVALRNPADAPIASFYLGVCYAAAGRDKEAVSTWERARAAKLQLPAMQLVLAEGWLRLGQPAQALEPLGEAHDRQPDNDAIRRSLAIAQSHVGMHEQAYRTIVPFLEKNTSDTDALLLALHALYQVRIEGRTIGSADEDKARAVKYSRAYAAAKGPQTALVEKWADFLQK